MTQADVTANRPVPCSSDATRQLASGADTIPAFVEVAIPSPLYRTFDYKWPFDTAPRHGQRIKVPFGKRSVIAIVLSGKQHSDVPANKLRSVSQLLESDALLPSDLVALLEWSSRYYRHPPGEVFATALPAALRNGAPAIAEKVEIFRATSTEFDKKQLLRAPVQLALMQMLTTVGQTGVHAAELSSVTRSWRRPLAQLMDKGLVETELIEELPFNRSTESAKSMSDEQQQAFSAVHASLESFHTFLLNGVTGSGKTEVYLQLIDKVLERKQQVLVLVPEISLTPQLLNRFRRRLNGCLVCLHSAMSDRERLQNWLLAAGGKANVVIGTRSAVFTPMPSLGLIIIDEEHDASLKQQDGFRYHARDLALMRARDRQLPVLLGSATPSLESLRNALAGRFTELKLTVRAGGASPPDIAILDIRRRRLQEGLSDHLISVMREHLEKDGQILLFLNRRGFAPTLICNDCGEPAHCNRCDAHMTVHARLSLLRCHHCGSERALQTTCESCQSENLDLLGCGTERVEAAVKVLFPEISALRIDRDSTRRKGALQEHLQAATEGEARILIGTQMLAKGHHFPNVTLVGILDADRGLYGTDFRSIEQMGQLIVQVAGRAGRENRSGSVLIQTRNPENPLLQTLVFDGYRPFANALIDERKAARLPPFVHVCLIRAEAVSKAEPRAFLDLIAHHLRLHVRTLSTQAESPLEWYGPVPAPLERLAGRYRAQLLIMADKRSILNQTLGTIIDNFHEKPEGRRIRWSIDVDPLDFY